MNNSISKPLLIFCYITLIFYIIGGNAFTINLGARLPLKIAEILSCFLVFIYSFNHKIRLQKHERFIIIWIVFGIFSAFITTVIRKQIEISDFIYGVFYSLRLILILLTAHVVSDCLLINQSDSKKAINFILKLYVIVCIIGYFQLIYFPKAYDFYDVFYKFGLYFPNPDPHINRLISLYFDPNYFAACLLIPFTISLTNWKYDNKGMLIYSIVFLIAILLTVSRSGFLGVTLTFLFVFFSDEKMSKNTLIKKVILVIIAGFIIAFLYSTDSRIIKRILNSANDKSTYARVDSWKDGFEIIKQAPFIGIGYNMIGSFSKSLNMTIAASSGYGNDSSIMVIFITTGIYGILFSAFALLNCLLDKSFITNIISKKIIICISLVAIIICNFNNLLFYPLWLFPFLLIVNIYNCDNANHIVSKN